ncbi:MAG: hypothetical protein VYC34_02450 [Planctomycetota bacterium]|nr:hypothetical protein [Planctomycetota bacterium]
MRKILLASCIAALACASASAWNAHGHRTVTYLALDGLPSEMPQWLRETEVRDRCAYQSNEPDRWRAVRLPALDHLNSPEHFIDLEMLADYGLTVETLPRLRRDFLVAMAIARHEHPEMAYDRSEDPAGKYEWPGFLPHAITEQYAVLVSSFNTYRTLVELDDPARAAQLEMAKENIIHHMGVMSHFVADAAQPLHTTIHHHGWVGENPNGYTTDFGFHAYIDGAILEIHELDYASLRPLVTFDREVNQDDPWQDVMDHIVRSFDEMERLYRLDRDGDLVKGEGKRFIEKRLVDGASMLSALYAAAWRASEPSPRDIDGFVKYNDFDPSQLPGRERPQRAVDAGEN